MPKTLRDVPVHSYRCFTWKAGEGRADASDFNGTPLAARLYADSCDMGFHVRGRKRRTLFVETSTERREGEIIATRYVSAEGFRIVIFND